MTTQAPTMNALELAVQNGKSVNITSVQGAKLAPQSLGEVIRFAEIMSRAGTAIPKHLRDNPGACMAVAMQALEWDMSPFAVASKSYVVNDVIAYEAQLITAVVNTRSGIVGRLKYNFEGDGPDRVCIVTGVIDGDELVYRSPRVEDIKPKNSPLWKNDPDQQQCYFSSRGWARRHTPEVILGVYDREEAQSFQGPDNARDVTPAIPLSKRLAEANASNSGEGFSQEHVQAETAEFTEIQEQDDQSFGAESSSRDDEPAGDRLPPDSPAGDFDQEPEPQKVSVCQRYTAELADCTTEEEVEAISNKFRDDINASGEIRACKLARVNRLKEIAEAA